LEKVRRIRNELERRGHNPLLFFLKCLEADDARLPELIRDGIKARTFLVLCNTRASRRSKWVKQEIENHGLRVTPMMNNCGKTSTSCFAPGEDGSPFPSV